MALVLAVVAILGLWIAMLTLLPDAPRRSMGRKPGPITPEAVPEGGMLAMPVRGMPRETVRDSWGDPRDNGKRAHHGSDIMAAANTPVIAAAPGTIEKLWQSAAGGITLYVRSPKRTWLYYYAHLSGYAKGIHEGQAVKVGDLLGFVGDTGNAGAGNYHLHFGLTRTTPDQHWYEGRDVDPYPYLAGKPATR